ncbi:hypothetical protein EVAR_61242_1 [Eumeta japonica]|uniref:Uncharacterized protein n=1 Tax=Eumeta variegata TaxID=151549 RepID=A0A4C1SLT2_EUMVA|nr:hypothetical protein EVAR_61242_1 [Eumeta japonica]
MRDRSVREQLEAWQGVQGVGCILVAEIPVLADYTPRYILSNGDLCGGVLDSTAALLILARVLPANYEVTIAGRVDCAWDGLTSSEVGALSWRDREEMIDPWQTRWDE